ncbi:DUF3717 domain-containing protein [Massilia sp. CF038]|uniref:DUF3717 domain-containing protein n=1 Tax=Massilia sp. CF038 TaxID=1881045 RepID=UPI000917EB5E|nr:DUF3717 domain-containing protein [Massilia sp. CF038]SHH26684.1 Protein of unknown function [Massilia sp. CF038]
MDLRVQELEAAINFWRDLRPARGNEFALSPEVNALATVYALMIFRGQLVVNIATLDPEIRRLLGPIPNSPLLSPTNSF